MSTTPAEIKPKFQSGYIDNAVPGQLGPSEWNESRLAAGGVTGDLFMRDTASTTGASWLTPDFASSGDVAAGDAATLSSANAHSDANDTTTLTSANTHADAGDATTLGTANAHADSGDSATLTSANSHSDTNDATTLSAANSHADAGDTTSLNSAKSYADTGDSTTLASAKSYADTKDTATLASANAHSDAGLAGLFSGSPAGGIGLSTGSTMAWLADVAVGSYLRSGGVGVAPVWSALTLPNAATLGDVLIATGTNAIGRLADVATGSVLASGGVGVAPAWSATPTLTNLTVTGQLGFGASADVLLTRDFANALGQRNGTNAQEFHVYNTFTDLSNYERFVMGFSGNLGQINVQAGGTGTLRNLQLNGAQVWLATGGTSRWAVNPSGHLVGFADTTYDIGVSGNRPRNYLGAGYVATGAIAVASLPAAAAGLKGARHFVTDASATTFQSIVASGGSNNVPVFCDGTNWRIG